MSMMDIAKANGIRVVLASVTPVCDCYTKQTGLRPQGKIISLNGWIRDFAAQPRSSLSGLLCRAGRRAEFQEGTDRRRSASQRRRLWRDGSACGEGDRRGAQEMMLERIPCDAY